MSAFALLTPLALVLALAPARDAPIEDDPPPSPSPIDRAPRTPSATEGPSPDYVDPLVVALTPVKGGLTADEVARHALKSAPTIGVRSAELQQAAARVDMTMVGYLPTLQAAFSYTRNNKVDVNLGGGGSLVGAATPGPLTVGPCPGGQGTCVVDSAGIPVGAASLAFSYPIHFFSLSSSLSVPISDYILSLVPARRSSKASVEAARLAREAEIIKVEADARIAYYNWLRTVAAVVVAEESVERSKARLADAQVSFETGVASKADVLRLDALVASTESTTVQARAARDLAARNLALMMAIDAQTFAVGEDVLTPPREPAKISDLDALITEAQGQRLELRSLQQNDRALAEGIKIYRAGYYPRLDAVGDVLYANPNQRYFPLQNKWNPSWSAGARLSYTLGQAMRARAQIKDAKASRQGLSHQQEQLRRGIALEVTQAFLDRQKALAAIELNGRAVRSSEEAYRVATDLFQAGTATTTDIIEAELSRVNATLQEVNARIDLQVATLKLLYSTGRLEPIEKPT
ncbi:MAG: TolC family protein [Nannocystaceae bacterium]